MAPVQRQCCQKTVTAHFPRHAHDGGAAADDLLTDAAQPPATRLDRTNGKGKATRTALPICLPRPERQQAG